MWEYRRIAGNYGYLPTHRSWWYAPAMASYEIKPPRRPNRVRETVAAYAADSERSTAPAAYALTMADRGRLVLPAEVREQLKIKQGDRLTLVLEADGSMRLRTPAAFITRLRGAYRHLAPGRKLADELIAKRRREAVSEDRKDREFRTRHKIKSRR